MVIIKRLVFSEIEIRDYLHGPCPGPSSLILVWSLHGAYALNATAGGGRAVRKCGIDTPRNAGAELGVEGRRGSKPPRCDKDAVRG